MAKDDTLFCEIKHPKKRAFLRAFSETGSITKASKAAKVERSHVWYWRYKQEGCEEFNRLYEIAYRMSGDLLEEEAARRAREGVRRKKFDGKGMPIIDPETGQQYEEFDYSDTLLIFLLKGAKPEKYRERHEFSRGANALDEEFNELVEGFNRFGKTEGVASTQGNGKPSTNGNGKHGTNGNGKH